MSMQLLGIGKGTLHRLLASFVDGLAPRREAVGVGALAGVGPHMAGDDAFRPGVAGAGGEKRAVAADGRIGAIVTIAVAVGGGISQELAFRAAITIHRAVIDEFRLAHHAGFGWCRIAIAGDTENGALLQSPGDAGCGIAGIEPDGADSKAEALRSEEH